MTDNVRFVADGEEIVLTADESYRIGASPAAAPSAPPGRIAIQYLGFRDAEGHREYALKAQRGDVGRRYTVSIALSAFSERRALLQDGPDICYQKLARMLEEADPPAGDTIAVTDGELEAYRAAHVRVVRRGFSSSPPPEGKTPEPATEGS